MATQCQPRVHWTADPAAVCVCDDDSICYHIQSRGWQYLDCSMQHRSGAADLYFCTALLWAAGRSNLRTTLRHSRQCNHLQPRYLAAGPAATICDLAAVHAVSWRSRREALLVLACNPPDWGNVSISQYSRLPAHTSTGSSGPGLQNDPLA